MYLTKDDLCSFLKENLKIKTSFSESENSSECSYSKYQVITTELYLGDDLISESSDEFLIVEY